MGGGKPLMVLDAVRRDYPLFAALVSDFRSQRRWAQRAAPRPAEKTWRSASTRARSEHLSWSAIRRRALCDLLPLPFTEEALSIVCRNVEAAQDFLGRRILSRTPRRTCATAISTIPEWEFVAALAGRTGCGILCDVNKTSS